MRTGIAYTVSAFIVCLWLSAATVRAQESESSTNSTPVIPTHANPPLNRDVSWRQLPMNFLRDQKEIWLFPRTVAEGHHWKPTIAVVGVTGALIAADPHDAPYFRRTANFEDFNSAFSGTNTSILMAMVPGGLYGIGLLRRSSYSQKTALFAGEAVLDTTVLQVAMKAASHRYRPSDIAPTGKFSDTFFQRQRIASSSFPSGHALDAFAIATVIARRYPSYHWMPWLAYGIAGAIGFSRITLQSHFLSDVFVGAALGYSVSRFAVLRDQ